MNEQCLAQTLRVNNILITFLAEDEECSKGGSSFNFETTQLLITQTQTTSREDIPFIPEDPVKPFISEDPVKPFISGKTTNINWSRDVVTTYFNEDSKQVHKGS